MAKQYKVLAGTHAEGKEIFGVGAICEVLSSAGATSTIP